jgi:hypothetical protein
MMNVKEIKRELQKANKDYVKACEKGDVEKMNMAEGRKEDLLAWMYEDLLREADGGRIKVRKCRECAFFKDCYVEDGEIIYNEEYDVAYSIADDCPDYEGYDPEDYMDDGDDRGDCVPTVREEYEDETSEDNVNIIVYKQLVDGMAQEFVGAFPNHYEANKYLESQGVYEQFWTDQFGRQWEIMFDEQILPKYCEERESFIYGI